MNRRFSAPVRAVDVAAGNIAEPRFIRGEHFNRGANGLSDRLPPRTKSSRKAAFCSGTGDRGRTGTSLRTADFKSDASTNYATPAYLLFRPPPKVPGAGATRGKVPLCRRYYTLPHAADVCQLAARRGGKISGKIRACVLQLSCHYRTFCGGG